MQLQLSILASDVLTWPCFVFFAAFLQCEDV